MCYWSGDFMYEFILKQPTDTVTAAISRIVAKNYTIIQ